MIKINEVFFQLDEEILNSCQFLLPRLDRIVHNPLTLPHFCNYRRDTDLVLPSQLDQPYHKYQDVLFAGKITKCKENNCTKPTYCTVG
jgi:hypothetical protein